MSNSTQAITLDNLKQMNKNGLSKAVILLAEAQATDYQNAQDRADKMEERMTKIESRVENVEKKLDNVSENVDKILILLQTKQTPLSSVKELFSNKVFLTIFFLLVSLGLGVNFKDVIASYLSLAGI